MEVFVRSRHLDLSESLRTYAARRMRFSVGAFDSRIRGVDVRVEDVNGPRGGIDKKCVVAVSVRPVGYVFARALDADAYAAIDRAATRIRAVLVRTVNRRGDPRGRHSTAALRKGKKTWR